MAATEEGVPPAETEPCAGLKVLDQSMPLSVVIFGATGDLAKKKLFPALYQLMLLGHMPKHINIVGYGRRAVKMEEFIPKQCAMVLAYGRHIHAQLQPLQQSTRVSQAWCYRCRPACIGALMAPPYCKA